MILLWVLLKAQPPEQVLLPSLQQLVEDVEVPLAVVLVHNSGFLQEVVQDVAPNRSPLNQTRHVERVHQHRGKCFCFLIVWSETRSEAKAHRNTENDLSFCATLFQYGGDLSAKIPFRNSPQRESTKTECGGIKGDLKDGSAELLSPCTESTLLLWGSWDQSGHKLCAVTQDRNYLQISQLLYVDLPGEYPLAQSTKIKYPRNKKV